MIQIGTIKLVKAKFKLSSKIYLFYPMSKKWNKIDVILNLNFFLKYFHFRKTTLF